MYWPDTIKKQIKTLKSVAINDTLLERMFRLIDLTSLHDDDTESSIAAFLQKAQTSFGHVASVCVFPQFVRLAASQFENTPIKTSTVVNFPKGVESLEAVLIEINEALTNGAQEIELVFPYRRYLAGEEDYTRNFVSACKVASGKEVTLKVILETGALVDPTIIADASWNAISGNADFIKTSTGKIAVGATLEAVATMLLVIREALPKLKRSVGIKISGGVKTLEKAAQYIELADNIMGREWVNANNFRLGSSKLVDEILART